MRSTSHEVKYSTPSLRPADTSASLIDWRPADRDRRGLERQHERQVVDEPLEPGRVVGEAAGRRRARAHEQRAQLVALEEVVGELAHAHELVDRLDARAGQIQERLERVRLAPRRRLAEAVRAEGRLPVQFERLEQAQVGVGVAPRERPDLLVRAVDPVGRALRHAVDDAVRRVADERRAVVEHHPLVALGEDVLEALGSQVEVAVRRVRVEARPVRAVVHQEPGRGPLAGVRSAAEVGRALEDADGQAGAREVGRDDRRVVAAAEDDGVVAGLRQCGLLRGRGRRSAARASSPPGRRAPSPRPRR